MLWLQSVEAYVRQTVIEPAWAALETAVASAESSEQVGTAHAAFAGRVRDRLLLGARHTPLRARIEALLQLCESHSTAASSAWRAEARLLVGVLVRAAALRHAPHRTCRCPPRLTSHSLPFFFAAHTVQELLARFDLTNYYYLQP